MITVVQSGGYSFIGEWYEMAKIMTSPRVMVNKQVSPTEVRCILQKLIGDPKEITISGPIVVTYEPRDKGLIDYYRSEVTGIQLVPAGAIPKERIQ